ncbi:MAG: enoyl-CoA hydratase/isomerase family protein [Acidimicrobiia bacterium]
MEGGLAVISLNRPAAGNAITLDMMEALRQAAADVATDGGVRALLLRANGPHFCVGGDIDQFKAQGDRLDAFSRVAADLTGQFVSTVVGLEVPVVVAVQGAAAGAGMTLACLGDVALAARSATFRISYTAIGLSPDGGATWFLPRLVGPRVAADLALTNRALTAPEAGQRGLVTRVVDDDALDAEARKVATRLAAGAGDALTATKRLLSAGATSTLEAQLARELDSIATLAGGPQAKEGIAAFLEKRPPVYR